MWRVLILDGNLEKGAHVRVKSLLFDLFKALDWIESSLKSDFLRIFIHACATCSKQPFNISTMLYLKIQIIV